jgi:bacteriorhodopsin
VITAQMSSTDVVSDEVLSPELKQAVIEEQLQFASDISIFFAAVFFMFLAFYIIFSMNDISMRVVKRSSLKMRLDYCVTVNLYICFFSCLFNTIQLADWDDVEIPDVNSTLDLARPIEWILTCPLMQICLVVVGGEKVKESRAVWAPLCSAIILCWGTASALAPWQAMKLLCYIVGAGFFLILCSLMNETIRESTNGMESLCSGQSNVRALTMLVVLTWIPFPIWYALSPEGFNIIQNAPLMRIAVSFLNIISKGTFTLFLLRLRANEKLTLSLKAEGQVDKSGNTYDKLSRDSYSGRLVAETLRSIGRMDETEAIMKLLDSHMVTTLGDILVLTPEYCEQIGLPWTFVYAFKEQYRRSQVNNADVWDLKHAANRVPAYNAEPHSPMGQYNFSVSPAAPHIARNPAKLAKVLGEHTNMIEDHIVDCSTNDTARTPASVIDRGNGYASSSNGAHSPDGRDGGDIQALVRAMEPNSEGQERMIERLNDIVNARVMESLNSQLRKHRMQLEDNPAGAPNKRTDPSSDFSDLRKP